MTKNDLSGVYRDYVACLNKQDWRTWKSLSGGNVRHNGKSVGLAGYRRMLEGDFRSIADLHFEIELLVTEPPHMASRLLC